jgi:hypothetical protein
MSLASSTQLNVLNIKVVTMAVPSVEPLELSTLDRPPGGGVLISTLKVLLVVCVALYWAASVKLYVIPGFRLPDRIGNSNNWL